MTHCFVQIACQLVALFGDAVQSASLPSKERFIHHMLQIRFNIVGVSSLVISASDQPPTTGPGDNLQEMNQVKFGDVLYPTLSLVNHSCQPNAILRFMYIGPPHTYTPQNWKLPLPMRVNFVVRKLEVFVCRFAGNRASLVATGPIKAGEEVTICYGEYIIIYSEPMDSKLYWSYNTNS